MIKKLTQEQIDANKKASSEAMQRVFRETAAKTFSAAKTGLEGIEGAKSGASDLANGQALTGLSKIAKPFLGGGLKMSYGKQEAAKMTAPQGPAPQGPASGPKAPGER